MIELPLDFQQRIRRVFKEPGAAWLARLPALLRAYEERWHLRIGEPFELSYHYVAPATMADGAEVVLKAGVPSPDFSHQVEALRLYGGRGLVRVIEADADAGVVLMERLIPGTTIVGLPDDEATAIAASVMRELQLPAPSGCRLPTLADWASALGRVRGHYSGGTGPIPERLYEMARAYWREMLASSSAPVVLHGDLHHWNILRDGSRGWTAIDPHGVTGEAEYEVAAYLGNPNTRLHLFGDLAATMARRLDIFAASLGYDRQRMLRWGIAFQVLSAWWSYEDGGNGEHALAAASALEKINPDSRRWH
jgi:streptomycin 6-kinase